MVTKKTGGIWRLCWNYRSLNRQIIPHKHSLRHIQDFKNDLQCINIFTKIDLARAYHNISSAEEDIPKIAITMPFRPFEFLRMPFGLENVAQKFR